MKTLTKLKMKLFNKWNKFVVITSQGMKLPMIAGSLVCNVKPKEVQLLWYGLEIAPLLMELAEDSDHGTSL